MKAVLVKRETKTDFVRKVVKREISPPRARY
jgi:hypothetical protein